MEQLTLVLLLLIIVALKELVKYIKNNRPPTTDCGYSKLNSKVSRLSAAPFYIDSIATPGLFVKG